MRCGLHNSQSASAGRRDVTDTSDDVRHVISLVVTRNNGEHVASISPFDPATAKVDANNLEVKGDISGGSSEGYLDLVWKDAGLVPDGEYKCEVNAITKKGHNVVFSTALEMSRNQPTLGDLIAYVKEKQRRIDDLEEQIRNKDASTELKINQILQTLNTPAHIETDTLKCGSSHGWSGRDNGTTFWSTDVTRSFQTAYARPPVVFVGVSLLHHNHNVNLYYDVELVSVNSQNFTVRCRTWLDHTHEMDISWVSYPQ